MSKLAFDKAVSFRWYDEDGRMHVDRSNLTRVQVAPYRGAEIPEWQERNLDPVKIYYGYRPAEELGSPETIKSVIGIPIQLNHHADTPDAPAMATRVGSTGDHAEFDGTYLSNSLHIQNVLPTTTTLTFLRRVSTAGNITILRCATFEASTSRS